MEYLKEKSNANDEHLKEKGTFLLFINWNYFNFKNIFAGVNLKY